MTRISKSWRGSDCSLGVDGFDTMKVEVICMVRSFFLRALTVFFVAGSFPLTAATADSSRLENNIENYIKSLRSRGSIRSHERSAWVVSDLSSGTKLASINESTPLQAASMIKPYLALAFFHKVASGSLPYGPKSRNHMEQMIQKSNNSSTNWVMKQTGGPSSTQALLKSHYPELCRQLSLVEYIPSGGRTYRNMGSAADYSRFLSALWNKKLPYSSEILRIMNLPGKDRVYTGANAIPSGTRVYNKTGSTAMCCGDMGILVAKGRNGKTYPYVVVGIIESAVRNRSYGSWISSRGDVIRGVSNIVYSEMKRRYPL
jgi:beta-lactamase class A